MEYKAISIDEDRMMVAESTLLETNFFEEMDRWKTHNQNHAIQKFKSSVITDSEYYELKDLLDTMKETEDFNKYSKAFSKFCDFCHIVPRGVILKKYKLSKGKQDHNKLDVEYSYNTKKITLPKGTILYHMSQVDGIKELNPVFRGKSIKGFMYDKPRVYFTIRKNMPKFLADYRKNEKLHMYIAKKEIRDVYVDPLVWANLYGAVYVETNTPIPVDQVSTSLLSKLLDRIEKSSNSKLNESFDIRELYNFITENGLEINTEETAQGIFSECSFI